MEVVREVYPGLTEPAARSAVHSVFGLLNSTPHLGRPGALPGRSGTAELLHRMARGAFGAAVVAPGASVASVTPGVAEVAPEVPVTPGA